MLWKSCHLCQPMRAGRSSWRGSKTTTAMERGWSIWFKISVVKIRQAIHDFRFEITDTPSPRVQNEVYIWYVRTCSGLKQEVTAAVVGHLLEEPVCSNWRWSVSQVFFIRICSISSICRICTPVVHCTICAPSTVFLAVSPCLLELFGALKFESTRHNRVPRHRSLTVR